MALIRRRTYLKLGANSSIYGSYLKDIEAKHKWKEEGRRKKAVN